MAKENSIKMKREPTVWENIFANDTADKGLISKIYKELTRLHSNIVCGFVYVDHSDWCEMVPHCGFNLHVSDG